MRYLLIGIYLAVMGGIVVGCNTLGWEKTWSAVQVLPEQPSFIDLRSVQAALVASRQGIDPQQQNQGDRDGRVMDYPGVWLVIADVAQLDHENTFRFFCLGLIILFVGACVYLLWQWPSLALLLCLLSPASLLVMERGNNDMLMFVLVLLFVLAGSRGIALLPGTLAVLLKIYPVAVFGTWLIRREKRLLGWSLPLLAAVFVYLWEQLPHIRAGVTLGRKLSYGLPHWAFIFNSVSLGHWAMPALLLCTGLAVFATLRFLRQSPRWLASFQDTAGHLFLAGASVYVLTYLLASNWDYRLIFLNLCVPFLLQHRYRYFSVFLVLSAMSYVPLHDFLGNAGVLLNLLAKYLLFVLMASVLLNALWQARKSP